MKTTKKKHLELRPISRAVLDRVHGGIFGPDDPTCVVIQGDKVKQCDKLRLILSVQSQLTVYATEKK